MAPRVPAPLVVVAAGIAVVALFALDEHGIALIAEVPTGLPAPRLPSFDAVDGLLPGAFAIALMAYLETVSVARAVRRPGDPPIDNDHELVANGSAALAGSFFGALPPAGGFSQTAVNESSGSKSQVSELVTVGLAVAAALFLGPVLDDLPEAILASIVFVAVIGLIKPAEIAFLARFDRLELAVAAVTALVGLTAGLLVAVGVGRGAEPADRPPRAQPPRRRRAPPARGRRRLPRAEQRRRRRAAGARAARPARRCPALHGQRPNRAADGHRPGGRAPAGRCASS